MKRLLLCAVAAAITIAPAALSAETWTGTITDSMCSVKHSADKHGDKSADHRNCVEKCINNGGEYVFVSGDKKYKIANQSFEGLKTHAAHEVMLTGELKGETITVSKIEMPAKK
jgi:Ni/Co efflux regulator RcnB